MFVGNENIISVAEALIALVVFLLVLSITRSFRKKIPPGLKRLPGPVAYPLIGNIVQMGKNPHLSFNRMRGKYGDVMQVHIGMRPVLVLSGLETIKQALVKQGEEFMARPDLYTFNMIADGQSLTFGRDTEAVWRVRKKLAQNALKTFSSAPSLTSASSCIVEEHVSEEASYLVTKLLQVMEEKGRFCPYRYVVISVANVICAVTFGKRYSHDDKELLDIIHLMDEAEKATGLGNLADFIPVLQYLPNPLMKRFKALVMNFNAFLQKNINRHYESFNKDHIRDITDSLIAQSQDMKFLAKNSIQLPEQKIVNLVNDLVGASFDTVTAGLSWCIMYLVSFPEIQKKIQKELDQTIGKERTPRLSDRALLPYAEAFILEVFRHSSYVPFTIPHCTTKDTSLNGFYIPKDLCVFVNQWQVNHDETLWEDPSSFNPDRFLSADGTEIDRAESEKVMLFGMGKRRCIGENLARWEVFLFLTTLLQRLEFTVSDGERVNMTPEYGLVMKPKKCENLQVRERFPRQSSE
ncbi:cytochrome P450 1A5 [Anolis carolinensis]|uniref:cytochrome P450 1A5 n=1 Tax=Anolis carolinensis TaxID=28377 RepID=UPI002F2B558E